MDEPEYKTEASLVRPSALLRYAGPTVLAASLVALFAGVGARMPGVAAITPLLVFLGAILTIYGVRTKRGSSSVRGELAVAGGEVRFAGATLARRDAIKSAYVVPQGLARPIVRLTRRGPFGGAIDLRVRDEAHGREVLRALGMDATQRVAVFRLPSQAFANRSVFLMGIGFVVALGMVAGAMAGALHLAAAFSGLLRPAVIALLLIAMFATRATLTVGADGLLLSSLGRRRFVRHADIADVSAYDDSLFSRRWQGVTLTLRSGEVLRIVCNQRRSFDGAETESRTNLVAERIREAMESARRGDPAHEAAVLGRNARDVGTWIGALRAIGAGAVDLRTAPIPPDRLWRLLEDPATPPVARAGAAVALGPSLDDEGRARVRVAAEATASPKLRVALEAATAENDAALAEALGAVEDDEERRGVG